jgi:beta-lactamase class A
MQLLATLRALSDTRSPHDLLRKARPTVSVAALHALRPYALAMSILLLASLTLAGCVAAPATDTVRMPSAVSHPNASVGPVLAVSPTAQPKPSPTSTRVPSQTPVVPPQTDEDIRRDTVQALQHEIEALVQAAPSGTWGVYVKELTSGETVGLRVNEVLHPASTIKVGIAMDLLYWMERHPEVKWTNGPQPNQRSFAQLLQAMLVKSEETATVRLAAFLDAQPGYHLVDRWQSWGVNHTTFIPRRSTPADLGRLLEILYEQEALTPESSTLILETMRIPKPSQDERIGSGLPAEARATLAHKTGTTFENGAGVVADSGIVEAGGKVLVIVVVGNRTSAIDYETSMRLIGDIARAAYQAFVGFPESTYPPWPRGVLP